MEHPIDTGRVNIIRALLKDRFGANIGCGRVHFKNKVNLDVTFKKQTEPDVLASVFDMPFRLDLFQEVVFSEVIEHLPAGSEILALRKIEESMAPGGLLVLTCPNGGWLARLLDPFFLIGRHRHYSADKIGWFLSHTRFKILATFSSGKLPLGTVTLCYALNWIFRRKKAYLFHKLMLRAYRQVLDPDAGASLFVICQKTQEKTFQAREKT